MRKERERERKKERETEREKRMNVPHMVQAPYSCRRAVRLRKRAEGIETKLLPPRSLMRARGI